MIPDRRKDFLKAAFVEAAVRFASDGRLTRAPVLLRREGVSLEVATRVLSPLGERRRPSSDSADRINYDADCELDGALSRH